MTEIKHKKNTAKELMIAMVDSTTPADLKSGLTVSDTAYYKDGAGAWTSLAITDTVTEIASTGMYTIEITAAELNHDMVMVKLTSAGAADTVYVLDMTTNDIDDISTVVPPTVTEMNNRTLPTADYFDPATDAVANVTLVDTTTTNSDLISAVDIAIATWDRILTGATHNIANSAGKQLREMFDAGIYEEETAQGGTANTITLAATASALDDFYNMMTLTIIDGTGVGQMRTFKDYNGPTKVATACMDWVITPDNTSKYIISAHACVGVFDMQTGVYDQINAECDLAITDYAGPTRIEATADKDAIIVEVDANEVKIDAISTVIPDVAGTAAGLHTTTDALVTTVDTVVDAIKLQTDNLPSGIKKNTAYSAFPLMMVDSTDHVTGVTGLTVTGNYIGDDAAITGMANAVTEISNGMYKINITAAELNFDTVTLIFTAPGADARVIIIPTSS